MRISVFGLGYVGCVTSACLAEAGHHVVGVELSREKIALINAGRSPFVEPGLSALIRSLISTQRLVATEDHQRALLTTDISIICVGTPSLPSGHTDLSALEEVCRQIAGAIRRKPARHLIVIRSTVLPGAVERFQNLIETISGKSPGRDFAVCTNPEFLREGSALTDFRNPPFTIVGAKDNSDGLVVAGLYSQLEAPAYVTDFATAQMIKYACNLFHGLKVVFGNEIGRVSKVLGADPHLVMEAFCADTKLNLSAYYLRPGFAFGGSCISKDLRAILALAAEHAVRVPVLQHIDESNHLQIDAAVRLILETRCPRVGVLGLSFKPDTDDLRESPHVRLVQALLARGLNVLIYDPNVKPDDLLGANRSQIERLIPQIDRLMVGTLDVLATRSDCIVIANRDRHFKGIIECLKPTHVLVDLVGMDDGWKRIPGYRGLSW